MKISIFLMFIGIGMISASSSYGQNTVLTLKVHNKTLKDVFREIENKSEYIFFYNDEAVNVNKRVDISIEKGSIMDILDRILDKSAKYKIEDRQVIIYKGNVPKNSIINAEKVDAKDAEQEKVTVSGKIIDKEGEPLPGVSVTEKGTTNGVLTDIDGNYSIELKGVKPVLEFRYVGHETVERTVGSQKVINITMQAKLSELDEVVVVAYGTQRKSSITGSISSVKIDEMKDITSPNVANMLQGKVAGVIVTPKSGQPGAAPSIRVRGTGSVSGNKEPLWVVDGVVGGMTSELNPNDIEAISLLKDGTATALYGSRGANGVVLVTTKRAASGSSQINASAKLGVSTLQKGNLRMMNGAEHYQYAKTAFENANSTPSWFTPQLANQNTDWWDIATHNALAQNYNVNYRYGNNAIRSYISGDYYGENGTIKGYNMERFTLRVNTDYIVNKRLTLKLKLANSYGRYMNQQYSLGYDTYLPWDSPYDSKGNLKTGYEGQPSADMAATADPRDYWYSRVTGNYLYDRGLNWAKGRHNAMDIGGGFDFKIFDFLTFESNNKFGYRNSYSDTYIDPNSQSGKATKGKVTYYSGYTRSRYTSQMFRFLKIFDEKHDVNAFLGYDYDDTFVQTATSSATNIVPGGEIIGVGADGHTVAGGKEIEKNAALFFNGNYAYDGRYLFQISARRDGSSRFGANKKWATFWAIGGGWNMHNENFIKNLGFVNELKLRGSYGTTGNLPPYRYGHFTLYQIDQEYANNPAFLSNYAGNPNLSWEETGSLDVGLDLRLFDRVSVSVDVYSKKVKNLLYLRRLSAITGFNNQNANDGKLENKGYEITITPDIIKTKDLLWTASFNVSYNKNKITYVPSENYEGNRTLAIGYSYNNWYMKEWAGVDPMTGSPLWFIVDKETGEKTATTDYNKATNQILGQSMPKYGGGISTNLTYKGFSFNASFVFSTGAKIYNSGRAGSFDRDGEDVTQPAMKLADGWKRWEKPGDIATHPRLIAGGNNGSSSVSSRYLENGDYFKMKTISLSYNIPKRLLIPFGISSANVSLGGENLFTITKFSGKDPEIYMSDTYNGSAGTGGYPTVRRFTLGLNLSF